MGEYKRRSVHTLDDVSHGKGLARSGNAEHRLLTVAGIDAVHQLLYRFGLIARRLVLGYQLESVQIYLLLSVEIATGRQARRALAMTVAY